MTREVFWADPRVKPAGPPFSNLQLRDIDAVQAPRGSGPRVRKYITNISASCLPRADAPIIQCHHSMQNNHQAVRTPSYSYQGIQQCDANPVLAEAVTTVVISRSHQYKMWPNV